MDMKSFEELVRELKHKTDEAFVLVILNEKGAQVGSNVSDPSIVSQAFAHLANASIESVRSVDVTPN